MSASNLNADATEWKPNSNAAPFVPASATANAPKASNMNTSQQQQQQQMGLNTNAPAWNHQQPQSYNPHFVQFGAPIQYQNVPPMFDGFGNPIYPPGAYGQMMPPVMSYHPNKHGNYQNGGNMNNHHHKKNYHQHNHGNHGQHSGDNAKSSDQSEKGKGGKQAKSKADNSNKNTGNNAGNNSNNINEEPRITFGDLDDNDSSGPSPTPGATSSSSETTSNTTSAPVKNDTAEKIGSSTSIVESKDDKQDEENTLEKAVEKPAPSVSPPDTMTTPAPEASKEEPPKKEGSAQSSGWKRNVDMVEKTASQMLLRNDGVTRYGKSQLCSMNSRNKTCPEEIIVMYSELAKHERPPMSEVTRQKSPNHKNNNHHNNHHKNKKNNHVEEPHPDELKIFNAEHLKSEGLFGGGRPDKVVDTTSTESIVAQANFILNVMTIETFDKMSDKFMKVGLETEELMKMAVDLIVSKAQLEEHFSFMYAELCKKITDQWVTSDGEEGALGKQFRLLLLKRCQEEFEQDRDAAVQEVLDMKLPLDDEEEKLLILKKRYTGHMRFVGEIYVKDMLKANKMHYCVTELLESKNEKGQADEEKLACLCKLFQTIGKKLEDYELKKKRTKVQEYFDSIEILSNDKSLSSKVRFGFKDLIEMRNNNWTARRVEEKARKLSEIRSRDSGSQNTPRSNNATPRNSSSFNKGGVQDARQSQDARSKAGTSSGGDAEWTLAPTKGKKGRGGSNSSYYGTNSASNTPTASSGSNNSNKFSALNINTRQSGAGAGKSAGDKNSPANSGPKKAAAASSKLQVDTTSSTESPKNSVKSDVLLPGYDGEVDANTTRRIVAAFDEYYGNLIEDEIVEVLKELVHENGMWKAVFSAMKSVMNKSESDLEKFQVLLPVLYKRGVLSREQAVKGISAILHEFDDMVIDVPKLVGYFGNIMAHLYVADVFETEGVRFITTLPEENDFTLSYRMMGVIVQIAIAVKGLSSEEKAIDFFKSALDVSSIDNIQKTQLNEAVEKFEASFLLA